MLAHREKLELRRPGGMLIKRVINYACLLFLLAPFFANAIYVGNQTFSIDAESNMFAKLVINNNKSARLYRITIRAIDSPGISEVYSQPADGELLFAPRQMMLQSGESDFFKFYYHGPADDKERYYRVAFEEIPPQNRTSKNANDSIISMVPVIVMDTILVVRPREINFKWSLDHSKGEVANNGNTWFKALLKPGCGANEDASTTWYLRPGESLHSGHVKKAGEIFILYNDAFIKIHDECT